MVNKEYCAVTVAAFTSCVTCLSHLSPAESLEQLNELLGTYLGSPVCRAHCSPFPQLINSLGLIHLAEVFLSDRKQTCFTCIQGSKLNTWHMKISKVTDLRKELSMGKHEDVGGGACRACREPREMSSLTLLLCRCIFLSRIFLRSVSPLVLHLIGSVATTTPSLFSPRKSPSAQLIFQNISHGVL